MAAIPTRPLLRGTSLCEARQRSVPRHYGSKDNPPTGSAVSISHISQSNTIVTTAARAIMRINKGARGSPPCQAFPDKADLKLPTGRKAKLGKQQKSIGVSGHERTERLSLGIAARLRGYVRRTNSPAPDPGAGFLFGCAGRSACVMAALPDGGILPTVGLLHL
jgi:hypothetical protein